MSEFIIPFAKQLMKTYTLYIEKSERAIIEKNYETALIVLYLLLSTISLSVTKFRHTVGRTTKVITRMGLD